MRYGGRSLFWWLSRCLEYRGRKGLVTSSCSAMVWTTAWFKQGPKWFPGGLPAHNGCSWGCGFDARFETDVPSREWIGDFWFREKELAHQYPFWLVSDSVPVGLCGYRLRNRL
jgi:hypothetical protein